MGDRWTLELLLTAGPWLSGGRSLEDKHLSAKLGAVEMVLKGCTAAYDLTLEWPAPTLEGLEAVGGAYAEVGMRAVVAPMVADRTFFEAIPGLMDVLPPAMQKDVEKLRPAPWKTSEANMRQALARWKLGAEQIRIAVAPTIPHHCSDEFISACVALSREHGVGRSSGSSATARRSPRIWTTSARSVRTSRWRTACGSTATTCGGSAATAPPSPTTPAATCGSATVSATCAACSRTA